MPAGRGAAAQPKSGAPLLELVGVSKQFAPPLDIIGRIGSLLGAKVRGQVIHAVDRVDLTIHEGEIVGLIGESGCGKSTLGRIAAGLLPPTTGERYWRGASLARLSRRAARAQHLRTPMIFGEPDAALDPRMRVVDIVGKAPVAQGIVGARAKVEYVGLQLNRVGVDPTLMRRFPRDFSGAQLARIAIARALALKPELLVCDEPVAALDASIRPKLLNLFLTLRSALGLAYLFISRDVGVVERVSDRVVVMYLGRVVESGPAAALFARPNHPYTQALLAASERLGAADHASVPVSGGIPPPLDRPSGCHFHPRCPHAMPKCREVAPSLVEIAPGRQSACHLNEAR
jgi:peptide/nickel transport system ATP-binding protein